MDHWNIITWIAGLLQLCVACYALRLNRLFGMKRVGWSLFAAFLLLAILHLVQSVVSDRTVTMSLIGMDLMFAMTSLLLLTGMVHIETILKTRADLEKRFRQKTADLARANEDLKHTAERLEAEVAERARITAQKENTYKELLAASREAGMSEVATNVLHNVGNVLNSVNISASLVSDHLAQMKTGTVVRIAKLLDEHPEDLAEFLTTDPKGKQLPTYLRELGNHLVEEQGSIIKEMGFVRKKIEHIKDIVVMQQGYARVTGVAETVKVADLVEDALAMNADALERHDVKLVREFDNGSQEITVEKHKVLQILVNLIRNAKYACDESGRTDKQMTVRVKNAKEQVHISVIDNGVGIPAKNLTKIFNHGFTTRKGGHGFGLHSGANAAKELNGVLRAHSEGPGKGATFTLELPREPKQSRK
jgi:C4-dicarboxylate-specific signal transduction histidine kinase